MGTPLKHDETDHCARSAPRPEDGASGPPTYDVGLPGRILVEDGTEAACTLVTIAGREARITTQIAGPPGACGRVVAYLDFVGRIEGPGTRGIDGAIALTITAPEAKWARLRQQFAILAALPPEQRDDLRGHRRIVPDEPMVTISLAHDVVLTGHIRDMSRSGAAVESTAAVAVGDRVTLGSTRGRVTRLFEGGFAVGFARLVPFERFGTGHRL